jgi:hypothetical protein
VAEPLRFTPIFVIFSNFDPPQIFFFQFGPPQLGGAGSAPAFNAVDIKDVHSQFLLP